MEARQIADTITFITKHKATKIGLQFPDDLLKESASIALLLKQELSKLSNDNDYKVYIMADTTFAPCCVDEISAQHVNADVIIHYGWTCCSPTNRINRIPVFNVLGQQIFNIQLLNKLLNKLLNQLLFSSFDKILILCQPHYNHYKNKLIELFKHKNIQFIISEIRNKSSLRCQSEQKQNENKNDEKQGDIKCDSKQNHFCGFYYDKLLDIKQWNELLKSDNFSIDNIKQKYAILYIGNDEFDEYAETPSSDNQLYLSLLTNFGSCFKFISYNPKKVEAWINEKTNEKTNDKDDIFSIKRNERLLSKMLMYRYSLIEKIKDSDIIGIVCATLVVDNYLDIIKMLKQTIRKSGKKSYMFSVGKINQAKLGNFSEIDIFVIITCPMSFHYLLPVQQQSFFKNLVTPFDIMLALNGNDDASFKWTGMYSTDFNDVLNHSFKMGGIKSQGKLENDIKNGKDKVLATYAKSDYMIQKKDATDYMIQKRSWKGVEVISDDVTPSKIEQGLTGIASQYEGEFK